ncbi:MAG: TAXI family TRAP transporter solute-binding subunit [Thermodesulfobacteriota bacterium]
MGRNKVRELSVKAWLKFFIPVILIMAVFGWASLRFVQPIPPKTLVISTGSGNGAFAFFGERYRRILARNDIRVKLLPSSGAVENLRRLKDESQKVDAGFVQDGMGMPEDVSNLVSLGSVFYTPLWVFYRGQETLDDPSQLKGKRINIGPEGSGIRKFALDLLKAAYYPDPPTRLFELPHAVSKRAMIEGRMDVVMAFATASSPLVQEMLYRKDIKLMSFGQAEAYTRLFPGLSHVILPRGILNLSERTPPSDVHLLASTANLIVRKDLHPALAYLLLKASVEIYSGAGWLHRAGEFPSLNARDFPVSDQAQRFYKSGGSVLYDSLPFWAAAFIDRMLLILIPLGVILIPLIGIMPWLYTWRNRSKYYRWYRALRNLEKEMTEDYRQEDTQNYLDRLGELETAVDRIKVSVPFYDEVFILKEHIQMVRKKLIRLNRSWPKNSGELKPIDQGAKEKIDSGSP